MTGTTRGAVGTVVGDVESGALEDDGRRAVDALHLAMAIGANRFGVVVIADYPLKGAATHSTTIFVYWHVSSLI
jgi:hypothetical protein